MTPGKKAPDFKLTDGNGKLHSLASFKSPQLVVYFYPKDDTPGCTIEAKEFSDFAAKLAKSGAQVVGISGGDDRSKAKFCTKHKITIPLLSDTDFSVAKAYGAYGDKVFMGRKFKGILRQTFILDAARKVVKRFDKVKPEGHAAEVLAALSGKAPAAAPKKSVATKKPAAPTKKEPTKKAPAKKTAAKKAKPAR